MEENCRDNMEQLRHQLGQMNASVLGLSVETSSQVSAIHAPLGDLHMSVKELQGKMSDFEHNPPNIGEVRKDSRP